jgi:glycosyltransferase involved in cell wall biosynthesis
MKILVVTPTYPIPEIGIIGGKFVENEVKALLLAGNEVTVLTPDRPGFESSQKSIHNLTVKRFRYFVPRRFQKLKDPKEPAYNQKSILAKIQIPVVMFLFMIHIMLRARKSDIIYCQWTTMSLPALPSKWIFGTPVIQVARGSDIRIMPKWLNTFIHKHVSASVDTYGPQEWNNWYKREFPYNFIKLPLVLELSKVPLPSDAQHTKNHAFNILYVSRFNHQLIEIYGHPTVKLLQAAKNLKDNGVDFHLTYIGDGEPRVKSEMNELIEQHQLQDVVTLLGFKNNVLDYIPHFDLGSGGSAFSTVSQEMAMNKVPQLLSSGFDNIDTPWEDKKNAYFFNLEDQQSLSDAIEVASANKEERIQIGQNAYNLMSEWVAETPEAGKIYTDAFTKFK